MLLTCGEANIFRSTSIQVIGNAWRGWTPRVHKDTSVMLVQASWSSWALLWVLLGVEAVPSPMKRSCWITRYFVAWCPVSASMAVTGRLISCFWWLAKTCWPWSLTQRTLLFIGQQTWTMTAWCSSHPGVRSAWWNLTFQLLFNDQKQVPKSTFLEGRLVGNVALPFGMSPPGFGTQGKSLEPAWWDLYDQGNINFVDGFEVCLQASCCNLCQSYSAAGVRKIGRVVEWHRRKTVVRSSSGWCIPRSARCTWARSSIWRCLTWKRLTW